MSQSESSPYRIYGVHVARNHSLFIDYLSDDVDDNASALLQLISSHHDDTLRAWQLGTCPDEMDVFEIESVYSRDAAEESVEFLRAYFRSLGETIVLAGHVCDRLSLSTGSV